ncbi:MAG: TolC family protein [Lacunisphaera sp.]
MSQPLRRLALAFSLSLLPLGALSAQEAAAPAPAPETAPVVSAPVVSTPGAAATPVPETALPPLTLKECIVRALHRNFDLDIGRYDPQIAKDSIEVSKGIYEPQLSVTGSYGEAKTGLSANGNPAGSSTTGDVRVGVTQQLYTGTSLSASTSLNRSSTNPAFIFNPAYDADLTLSARQSLLRGFGSEVNRAPIERAKIGFDRANLDYQGQILQVVQSTENAYFNLAFAREDFAVKQFSLTLAERLYDEAKTRRQTGVATDLDVLTGEVGVANARRALIQAEQAVKDRQDALLALIGQFELDAPVGTVKFLDLLDAAPVYASSLELAKQHQPEYLSAKAAIEQYKIDVKLAQDSAKPDLSVGAAVGLNGDNRSSSDAYGDAFDRENHSWQVDVAFTYPWGRGAERARERQSRAVLNREQTRLRQLEQSLEVNVRTAVRSVETNLESVKIASLAAALSQKQYELEDARFKAGLSTSRRVLEAQDDLETARVAELDAKVALHTSVAALHRLEGTGLQRYAAEMENAQK